MRKGRQWDYRYRRLHRHLRGMATGSMLGLFPVMMMVFLGLWWDVHCSGYFTSEEYLRKRFCEMIEKVIPQVEAYRNEYGHLPDTLRLEGFRDGWEVNDFVDTTAWNYMGFIYHHFGDTAFVLFSEGFWAKFVSAPQFEGYLFPHWDDEGDKIRVDTVFVNGGMTINHKSKVSFFEQ